ncbi:MAG: selenoneine synthase SenA [Candidatus Poribacteria bacterium]|nr:selenoneine synthase SenA [Candidatus Poribacteria bacterium]MDE0502806.1 selenoneine synthase SenA [Candidatus Poribacteria bacterium]
MESAELAEWVRDARQRTIDLVADLDDEQLVGPYLPIINPMLWEIGHVAWFQEKWVLRHVCERKPIREDADANWDSIAIPHTTRWDLPLPSRDETIAYLSDVRDSVLESLQNDALREKMSYFVRYTTHHEDMHNEAFTYTRQTLGYPPPRFTDADELRAPITPTPLTTDDAEVPGGVFFLGASQNEPFVFDNEKWAHSVEIEPFAIGRTPVTQAEFLGFVEEGGYRRSEFWTREGWKWRESVNAEHPVYWKKSGDKGWIRRHFDRWCALESNLPVIHVNWHEAMAYCRWAGRRLPTEAEWEFAAAMGPESSENMMPSEKRRFPWGDADPSLERVNMDWQNLGCIDVGALPDSDSAVGCRQMIGNVWEWTISAFQPYPGFERDAYEEYSEPWFGTRKVLRGGCWSTRSRMLRNTWRNFYTPDRRDVLAGLRTCAL